MTHQTVRLSQEPRLKARDWMHTWATDLSKAFNTDIRKSDISLLGFLFAGLCWLSHSEPAIMLCFLVLSSIALMGKVLVEYSPSVGKIIGKRIRVSHVAIAIALITTFFTVLPSPAQAVIFEALETEVNTLLNGSVDAAVVGLIFTALRVFVILGFIVGGIFLVNQALQGGDWKPMGNLMGIGLAFIIAVEVITRLILGA
ncbi:MAG: hypothetical protein AAGD25_15205 [Cyanobacteria bacterium P01_F01_bin.150]